MHNKTRKIVLILELHDHEKERLVPLKIQWCVRVCVCPFVCHLYVVCIFFLRVCLCMCILVLCVYVHIGFEYVHIVFFKVCVCVCLSV